MWGVFYAGCFFGVMSVVLVAVVVILAVRPGVERELSRRDRERRVRAIYQRVRLLYRRDFHQVSNGAGPEWLLARCGARVEKRRRLMERLVNELVGPR